MRETRLALAPLALAAVLAGAGGAAAEDVGGVTVRGFVSQGYLHSSENRFLDADTDEGTFAFTEAALNFSAQPAPKIRVAAQVFARDLGHQGNNRAVLDWGLGEYRALDQIGVRVGRVKFPVGLYNTLADADVARPEIFQPGGVYPPERRDLTSAIDGGGVFGTVALGRAGYLEYEGLYGEVDLDQSYVLSRAGQTFASSLVPALAGLGLSGVDYVVSDTSSKNKRIWGGHVEWHPPVAGLRVRTGVQGTELDLAAVTTYSAFAGTAPVSLAVRTSAHTKAVYQVVFSGEYSRGGLRLTAEHLLSKFETRTSISGTPFPVPVSTVVARPSSTYGQAAYRFNERFQASAYYSVNYQDRDDKDGRGLVLRGQPASNAFTKDLAATVRVDVDPHFLVKAELHRFDGTYNLSQPENPKPLEKDWTLFAVKATVHF
jgi:hypothetical protein